MLVLEQCAEDAVQNCARAGRARIDMPLWGLLHGLLIDRTHQASEDVTHAARLLLRLRPATHQTTEQVAQAATLLLRLPSAQHTAKHPTEPPGLLLTSAERRQLREAA